MHVHDSGQMDNEAESEEDAFDQNASPLGGGGEPYHWVCAT